MQGQSKQVGNGIGWEDFLRQFFFLVIQSPMALVTLVLSAGLGYGLSFVVFDYRKKNVAKSHFLLHPVVGLSYAAVIFGCVNLDIISKKITYDNFVERMPLTLLISFIAAFFIIIIISIIREIRDR